MTPETFSQYQEIGRSLARHLQQHVGRLPPVLTLQAVAADLAAGNSELLLPLKDLVSRPGFSSLAAKASSGGGALEGHALLKDMQATFSPQVIIALDEVLAGFLDLPCGPIGSQGKAVTNQFAKGESASTTAEQEESPSRQTSSRQHDPSQPGALTNLAPRGTARLSLLTAIAVGSAGMAAGAIVAFRSTPFCGALGLCHTHERSSGTQQALNAANEAEQDLRRAQGLADYRQATEQIEGELLKLSGASLTTDQERQRQRLQATAIQARSILAEEEVDMKRLGLASRAIDAARTSIGEERLSQLNAARQELGSIPARSFSSVEADQARQRLIELERQLSTPSSPETSPTAPEAVPEAAISNKVAPQPEARTSYSAQPIPLTQSPSPARETTPDRDQPLF